MTITIRKLHLAIAVLAVTLIAPATAVATHIFTDVPDGSFYAGAVEWAFDNDLTTGSPAGSGTFKPNDPVTRGESITFDRRYDDNIVQPALATLTGNVAANAAAIGAGAGVNFADGHQELDLTAAPQSVRSVALVAPAAGHVIVTASGFTYFQTVSVDEASCSITDGAVTVDAAHEIFVDDFDIGASRQYIPLSGTRTFAVSAGTTTFHLVCAASLGTVSFNDSQITALYVPNLYAP